MGWLVDQSRQSLREIRSSHQPFSPYAPMHPMHRWAKNLVAAQVQYLPICRSHAHCAHYASAYAPFASVHAGVVGYETDGCDCIQVHTDMCCARVETAPCAPLCTPYMYVEGGCAGAHGSRRHPHQFRHSRTPAGQVCMHPLHHLHAPYTDACTPNSANTPYVLHMPGMHGCYG